MRAGLFLEGMARRHAVDVAALPAPRTPAGDESFLRRLASTRVTIELEDPGRREWPAALLSSAEGRRRAEELYPLPTICRLPAADGLRALRRLAEGAALVHVMRSYLAPWIDFLLDRQERPPLTLDLDELDSVLLGQAGNADEAQRFERLESYYLPRFDHVYAASAAEARAATEKYGLTAVTAVPNAVWPPAPAEVAEPEFDLLFVGNLSYEPNALGARWLCEEVRPHLPGKRIAIVGSSPRPEVRALAELPEVTVAGDVPEVEPWYARSRVATAPLWIGAGTRIKILEALANGRPVVATPVGAAGLDAGDDVGILIAQDARRFAAACRRLLDEPRLAARLAASGRSRLKMADAVAAEIDVLTQAVVRGPSGGRPLLGCGL